MHRYKSNLAGKSATSQADNRKLPKTPGNQPNIGTQPINQVGIKKIHPDFLPTISLSSGGFINQIRDALITYCQREFGTISKIFLPSGRFEPPTEIAFAAENFTSAADPGGIKKARLLNQMKVRDADIESYNASKLKVFAIITSMMTKDMDEKIKAFFSDLRKRNAARSTVSAATATATATADPEATTSVLATLPEDSECPLALWKAIVTVLTSKTSGNLRIDQDNAAINFSTAKQRGNESINDFLYHRHL